jgi:hypothetical protein
MNLNNLLWQKYILLKYAQSTKKERNNKYFQLVDF